MNWLSSIHVLPQHGHVQTLRTRTRLTSTAPSHVGTSGWPLWLTGTRSARVVLSMFRLSPTSPSTSLASLRLFSSLHQCLNAGSICSLSWSVRRRARLGRDVYLEEIFELGRGIHPGIYCWSAQSKDGIDEVVKLTTSCRRHTGRASRWMCHGMGSSGSLVGSALVDFVVSSGSSSSRAVCLAHMGSPAVLCAFPFDVANVSSILVVTIDEVSDFPNFLRDGHAVKSELTDCPHGWSIEVELPIGVDFSERTLLL